MRAVLIVLVSVVVASAGAGAQTPSQAPSTPQQTPAAPAPPLADVAPTAPFRPFPKLFPPAQAPQPVQPPQGSQSPFRGWTNLGDLKVAPEVVPSMPGSKQIVCGMTIITPDPNIDPGFVRTVPGDLTQFTMRRIVPPVCVPDPNSTNK